MVLTEVTRYVGVDKIIIEDINSMTEHDVQSETQQDSRLDAFAAITLIFLAVAVAVFWVSGQ
tara:strand:+ start:9419 stop:9604 length:186 start_codon:yes stop_codon:yes gene_type:complete